MKSEPVEHKASRRVSRRDAELIRHLVILAVSMAISMVFHLIRLGVSHPQRSPFRDYLTLVLFLFLTGELILRFASPRFRRKFFLSLIGLRKKEPMTRRRIAGKVLFALLGLIGISFFCVHSTDRFDRTTERLRAQKEVRPLSGEILEQEIIGFEDAPLSAVNIRFGANESIFRYAYEQTNTGTVHIGLYENDHAIQSWDLSFDAFKDTGYQKLELDSLLRMQSDARYYLRIQEEYGEDAGAEENGLDRDYREDRAEEKEQEGTGEESVETEPILLYVYAEGGEGYTRDGEPHTCCLCYTLTYRNLELKNSFLRNGILLGLLVAVIILLDLEETAVMAVVLGILLLVFMQICPPFMAPDEENHFKRAFEVAKVSFVSTHIGELGVGGNELPSAVEDYVRLYIEKEEEETLVEEPDQLPEEDEEEAVVFLSPASFPAEGIGPGNRKTAETEAGTGSSETDPETSENANAKPVILLDWDQTEEMMYGNTALYSPVSYLPMSAGIRIANVFSDNVAALYYGGRWGNVFANFLLCVLALYMVPFGKRILFLVMTFPMTLQEMVVMTPDGFTISVCLLFLALVLRLSYGERSIEHKENAMNSADRSTLDQEPALKKISAADMAVLAVTTLVLSQLKIVYVILLLLLFMIPGRRFRSKQAGLLFKGLTAASALIINLLWLRTSSGFLVEFRPGVDTPAQIDYVLSHIPFFYTVCARSLINSFTGWTSTMLGSSLGALNISTTPAVWLTASLLFVYEMTTCRENKADVHLWTPLLLILSFLGGCALIMASLYVQWTPYRNPVILGIQGRYFTPLLPLLAFFVVFILQNRRKQQGFDPAADAMVQRGTYCYLLILLYNGIAVLDIASHFIAELW